MPHYEGMRRFDPSMGDSDWYMLTSLRRRLEEVVSLLPQKSMVFDYGCGYQPYKDMFLKLGHTYVGGDLAGNDLADVTVEKEGKVPVGDNTFDVIISIQVLEHVDDVGRYLDESCRILKPGGHMIVSTHGWWTYHPYPTDYWRWTRVGLVKTLSQHGFEFVHSRWLLGMLAYSTMLRLQCIKGLCEKIGRFGRILFPVVSCISQLKMYFEDKITPESIGKDNAAVYLVLTKKN